MTEGLFATLVLISAMGPTKGTAMAKVSEFLSMEDCEASAKGIRTFYKGRPLDGDVVLAVCVPSFMDTDDKAK